jgi:Fe-S-cluster containining protein
MSRLQHSAKKHPPHLLSTRCTPETVFVMVDTAARQASAQVEQSAQRSMHACMAGCTFCCHLPVDVTAPEALRMVAYLQQALSPAALAVLHARIAATAMQINGLSYEDHAQAKIPCALLMDGTCMAYLHRPFACRAWNSTSQECCESIFQHGDPVTMLPPLDIPAYEAVWKLAQDMVNGLKQARLDSHTYELHSVLLRVLEIPDAAERWLQRDNVFAGCLIGAYTHDA